MTASFGGRYSALHGQSEPMGIEWYGESCDNRGHQVNHKYVYRIYREEKLGLRRKRRRKTPEHLRIVIPAPEAPNICWSMDFVSDALLDGRASESSP